ncbi:hypothetical protein ACRRTK_023704 [Alexandromys fortis]
MPRLPGRYSGLSDREGGPRRTKETKEYSGPGIFEDPDREPGLRTGIRSLVGPNVSLLPGLPGTNGRRFRALVWQKDDV